MRQPPGGYTKTQATEDLRTPPRCPPPLWTCCAPPPRTSPARPVRLRPAQRRLDGWRAGARARRRRPPTRRPPPPSPVVRALDGCVPHALPPRPALPVLPSALNCTCCPLCTRPSDPTPPHSTGRERHGYHPHQGAHHQRGRCTRPGLPPGPPVRGDRPQPRPPLLWPRPRPAGRLHLAPRALPRRAARVH
jgi:hypothetical protein